MFVPTIPGWTRAVKAIIRVIMTQEFLKENNLEINSTWMNKYHFINFMATLQLCTQSVYSQCQNSSSEINIIKVTPNK